MKRLLPPPSTTSTWWSTVCSAIEPRPPTSFVSFWQSRAASAGPWQPRSEMCESSTAGVASVISAVETLPVSLPWRWATSSTVLRFLPGSLIEALGPCEIRSSIVFWPVAHIVPVDAESGS
jgi:hypothetical protein